MQFDARGVTPLVGEEIRQTMRCGGSDIGVTTHYLTKDGRAWLPVMGELHYSRILQKDWEKELLKMKDGGVEIISSYVFWLHHETEPGKFNWEGNYSLRAFIKPAYDESEINTPRTPEHSPCGCASGVLGFFDAI